MDFERWVNCKIDEMKTRMVAESGDVVVPPKILSKITKCSPDTKNSRGETLMIAVVRYISDDLKQLKFMQILFRAGADPNLGDTRHSKTPLMFACLEAKMTACRLLASHPAVDLTAVDKNNNTALIYARMGGNEEIQKLLQRRLDNNFRFELYNKKKFKDDKYNNNNTTSSLNEEKVRRMQNLHQEIALKRFDNGRLVMRKSKSTVNLNLQTREIGKIWQMKSNGSSASSTPAITKFPKIPNASA